MDDGDVDRQIRELEADIQALQSKPDSATNPDLLDAIGWRQDRLAELRGEDMPQEQEPDLTLGEAEIREMFEFYSNFGRSTAQGTMDTMDSFMFMKFAKECPELLDGRRMTRTEVDLIFTKAKPKGERRLGFKHFLDALAAFSEKKFPGAEPAEALQALLTHHLAPQYEIVQMELAKTGETEVPVSGVFKRLYDVRNYTGVYAERFRSGDGRINSHADNRVGRRFEGNTNTGTDEVIHNIASIMRPNLRATGSTMTRKKDKKTPKSASRRGGPRGRLHGTASSPSLRSPSYSTPRTPRDRSSDTPTSHRTPRSAAHGSSSHGTPRSTGGSSSSAAESVRAVLSGDDSVLVEALSSARSGNTEALCRLTLALAKEARRISDDNERLKDELASVSGSGQRRPKRAAPAPPSASSGAGDANLQALKQEVDDILAQISRVPSDSAESQTLMLSLRQAQGMYEKALAKSIRGGAAEPPPLPIPTRKSPTRSPTTGGYNRRSKRGGDEDEGESRGRSKPKSKSRSARSRSRSSSRGRGRSEAAPALMLPPDAPPVPDTLQEEHLEDIFTFYCNFGRSTAQGTMDTMDSFMFMKFAKECPSLLSSRLTRTDVDLIFTKAKPKGERRLDFRNFLDALSALSEKKYGKLAPADGLRRLLTDHLAPLWSIVQHELAKTGETDTPVSGVFKRLYDVRNYTGVYAERFRSGDGRINSHADNRVGRRFEGNTNTGTDEVIHNIASIMRPNLRATGSTMTKKKKSSRRMRSPTRQRPDSP